MWRAFTTLALAAAALGLPPVQAPAHADDDPVVAIVDGTTFHRSDLEQSRSTLPAEYQQLPLDAIYGPMLDRLIDGQLLVRAALQRDLQDDPAVKAEIDRVRAQVLQQQLIRRVIEAGTTPERLQATYDAMRTQPGFAQEEVHAQHILVASEEEAKKLIAELNKGASFAELAKANSTDPSGKENGGDLGWFTRDMMVPEFSEAAFAMAPGTYSKQPVHSQFGWHVIRVEERRMNVPSFADKEPELRQQVAREIVTALLDSVRKDADVHRFNIDGSPQAN